MIVGLHVDLIDYHLFSCTVKKVGKKKNGRMVQGGRGKVFTKSGNTWSNTWRVSLTRPYDYLPQYEKNKQL